MPGVEVSLDQFCSRLASDQVSYVRDALAQGQGAAMYGGSDWRATQTVLTWGKRGADFPGFPPSSVPMGGELSSFVSPQRSEQQMVSPALRGRDDIPQIRRVPTSQPHTEYPAVQIESRTSSHPRGDAEYLNLRPGRAQPEEEPEPSLPTGEDNWWARRMGLR